MTKCTFHEFGPSGQVQRFDGLCMLPLNIINEKIYVFLWFWFIILALVSGLSLLYRLTVVLISQARMYRLRAQAWVAPRSAMELVVRKCQIGDWFVLLLLGKNIDPLVYKEVICDLARRYEGLYYSQDDEPQPSFVHSKAEKYKKSNALKDLYM